MVKRLSFFLLLATASFGQATLTALNQPKTVTMKMDFTLDRTDEAVVKNFAAVHDPNATLTAVVFWGDDEKGAKVKEYSEYQYADNMKMTHEYQKPGHYGIVLVLLAIDKDKNGQPEKHLIYQSAFKIEVHELVTEDIPQ